MSDRVAEISAAYAAATPGLGAGHALEARLIGPAAYAARLVAARDAVNDAGADAALIGFGADMRYLTGYAAPALERLTMLVVPARGEATLIVPRLEAGMAGDAPAMRGGSVTTVPFGETDDPFALVAAAVRAGARGGSALCGAPRKLGVCVSACSLVRNACAPSRAALASGRNLPPGRLGDAPPPPGQPRTAPLRPWRARSANRA